MGLYNGLWGLGGLVGMLAGGFLVDQLSIPFVTTLFALAAVVVFPFIVKLVPKNNKNVEENQLAASRTVPGKRSELSFNHILSLLLLREEQWGLSRWGFLTLL